VQVSLCVTILQHDLAGGVINGVVPHWNCHGERQKSNIIFMIDGLTFWNGEAELCND
jgi:hypothetical protein